MPLLLCGNHNINACGVHNYMYVYNTIHSIHYILTSDVINVQVHPVDVTEEVYNIISHGYAVIELWGHQGAVFDQAKDDDDKQCVYQIYPYIS